LQAAYYATCFTLSRDSVTKGPFTATQLDVELSCVAINGP